MTTIEIDIPREWWWSANDRLHWAVKARNTRWLRQKAAVLARPVSLGYDRARVTAFVAYPKGTGRADPGNVVSTVIKALIDGCVTDAGLLADDDSKRLIGPDPRRDTNTCTKDYRVRLVFTEEPGR